MVQQLRNWTAPFKSFNRTSMLFIFLGNIFPPFSGLLVWPPVWPDWALFWTLGNFWSLWQQLICPNLPHSYGIFVRVSKSFIVLVKSFMANFYRHLAFFSGHNDHVLLSFFLPFRRWRKDLLYTRDRFTWLMTAHSFYACNGPLSTLMCRCMCVCGSCLLRASRTHALSLA